MAQASSGRSREVEAPLEESRALRVVIAGGGVAALELALALDDLGHGLVETLVIAPNREFVHRPFATHEPFAYGPAERHPLRRITRDAGADLLVANVASVVLAERAVCTSAGERIRYDALAIAVGARASPCFAHALTIDDRSLGDVLGKLLGDVLAGSASRIGFLVPPSSGWQLPIYELALMLAARASEAGMPLRQTIVTPEAEPLAIFGHAVSDAAGRLLGEAGIELVGSASASVPQAGEVVLGDGSRLSFERLVALPELTGCAPAGLPVGRDGFLRVDRFGRVPGAGPVFAAGDAIDFPIKHGGLAAQQADVAARSIVALAGADVELEPFLPEMNAVLLTGSAPRYLTARATASRRLRAELSELPSWPPGTKVASRYLGPYLEGLDRSGA